MVPGAAGDVKSLCKTLSMAELTLLDWGARACVIAAAIPVVVGLRNLFLYRSLPEPAFRHVPSVSVLVPARNEESRIQQAVESVLRCEGVSLEVLVWDDASTDGTARVVRAMELRDSRVRLLGASEPPPPGWAGKQFACARLAEVARGELLVFMDADVCLRRADSLFRIAGAFLRRELDFLSGVPSQKTVTWSEQLIVPLIHFVLLGFLPMDGMRHSTKPGFAAGCGQLIAVRAAVYRLLGGHALVRGSFHEGIGLARAFRVAGRVTDLADFSSLAVCRMYEGVAGVWNGFSKNAHEGLASPKTLIPMSSFLLCGQVLPFFALIASSPSVEARNFFGIAYVLGMIFRAGLAFRFDQPWLGVLLHPVSVAFLLVNQWYGALRRAFGVPVGWRGRTVAFLTAFWMALHAHGAVPQPVSIVPNKKCPDFALEDQHGHTFQIRFPRKKPCLLVIAGRRGTGAIAGWVQPVQTAYGDSVEIMGLADVHAVPAAVRPAVRMMIRRESAWPVFMDWSGKTVSALFTPGLETEVLVLKKSGEVTLRLEGSISEDTKTRLLDFLRACGAVPVNAM